MNESISLGGRPTQGFALGYFQSGKYHSWSEVNDLVNAYSYTINRIDLAIGPSCGNVMQRRTPVVPPGEPDFAQKYPALDAWADDYNNAYAQFMYVRDAAVKAMSGAWSSTFEVASAKSDDPAFADAQGNVFDALAMKYAPIVDLDRRLREISAAGGGFPSQCLPTYPNMPQPKAADYSIEAYKMLDAVVRGGEGAAKSFGDSVKDFLSSPPVVLLEVVAVLAGGAFIVSRTTRPREQALPLPQKRYS